MVKEDRSHIVQVTVQGKETPSGLIGPNLDFVIISARNKQRLRLVKIYPSDRTIMLFKSIYKCSHTIIPKLNGGRMKRHQDPWPILD